MGKSKFKIDTFFSQLTKDYSAKVQKSEEKAKKIFNKKPIILKSPTGIRRFKQSIGKRTKYKELKI
jgi:hypothetical protein